MSPPKYVDLIVLAAALAVFLLGGFPMLGYVTAAVAWIVQRGVQWLAQRRSTGAAQAGNRQRAMGIIAATTLGRVWLMATTSWSSACQNSGRALLGGPPGGALHDLDGRLRLRPPPRTRRRHSVAAMKTQIQSPDRPRGLPGRCDRPPADLRQRRQERMISNPERVQLPAWIHLVGHRPLDQSRGPLPLHRQRPDDRDDDLIARRMAQKPNRVQTGVELSYELVKNNILGDNLAGQRQPTLVPLHRDPLLLSGSRT